MRFVFHVLWFLPIPFIVLEHAAGSSRYREPLGAVFWWAVVAGAAELGRLVIGVLLKPSTPPATPSPPPGVLRMAKAETGEVRYARTAQEVVALTGAGFKDANP